MFTVFTSSKDKISKLSCQLKLIIIYFHISILCVYIVYISSKSSCISLYSRTCCRIFDESTHVTKSSIVRVMRKAGSLIVSLPTRTCSCSTSLDALLIFSDILLRTITTGSRRRQNALAEILLAFSRSHRVGIRPIT